MKPKPYYEDDHVTLYQGDCVSILPHLDVRVDAVIMDPPYASGTRKEAAKSGDQKTNRMLRGDRFHAAPMANDQMTTLGFVWLMREVLLQCRGLMFDGAHVASFIDWRNWPNLLGATESCDLRANSMVVWDKCSMGMGNGFRNRHELILHASVGVPRVCSRSVPDVLRHARDRKTNHPAPKPIGLIEDLLRVMTNEGETVIDPFAGAGSTPVAAKLMGRKAIAIEMNPGHCETIVARLKAAEFGEDVDEAPVSMGDFLALASE